MSRRRRTPPAGARFRVTVAEVIDGVATVVMDATGRGSTLPSATTTATSCWSSMASGATPHLLEHLAELIANHPTGGHHRTR